MRWAHAQRRMELVKRHDHVCDAAPVGGLLGLEDQCLFWWGMVGSPVCKEALWWWLKGVLLWRETFREISWVVVIGKNYVLIGFDVPSSVYNKFLGLEFKTWKLDYELRVCRIWNESRCIDGKVTRAEQSRKYQDTHICEMKRFTNSLLMERAKSSQWWNDVESVEHRLGPKSEVELPEHVRTVCFRWFGHRLLIQQEGRRVSSTQSPACSSLAVHRAATLV